MKNFPIASRLLILFFVSALSAAEASRHFENLSDQTGALTGRIRQLGSLDG